MSLQTSVVFAAAKQNRVPLAELDAREANTAKKIGRLLPVSADRAERASSFNSAL